MTTFNRPLLFWSVLRRPDSYIGHARRVSKADKKLALSILPQGHVVESYAGWAECRICSMAGVSTVLGTKDLAAFGFVWPEKAEHYIEKHEVWTADLDDFVKTVRKLSVGSVGAREGQ